MTAQRHGLLTERTAEHIRFTWACTVTDCDAAAEHEWTALAVEPCSQCEAHTRHTGHETFVIRESRQITTIKKGA